MTCMQINHIGNDFTQSFTLNLLPGIRFASGLLSVEILYASNINLTYNHTMFNVVANTEINIKVGRDVRDVIVTICSCYSYQLPVIAQYTMRIDNLFLLNIASRLIKKPNTFS